MTTPTSAIETAWRACLAESDFPTHYTAPEYFHETIFFGRNPFAVLSTLGGDVRAIMTGVHHFDRVQSGMSNRPQIAFSRHADRSLAMNDLIAGLLQEAGSASLIDLFLWSDMAGLVDFRFRQRPSKGVVILDLSVGPDALFRRFSQTRRNDIRRAVKCGVSVDLASGRDDVSAYYAVCLDWARRRFLRIADEEQFQRIFAVRTNRQLLLARYKGEVVAGLVLRYFPGGVVELAANSSLQRALQVKPNDLLHWRAIEWACANGLTKYSLGGRSLFLRKFGGEIVPTTRHRMDLSLFRQHTIMDWMADKVEDIHPLVPPRILGLSRSLRTNINKLRSHNDRGSA